jgi:hypothetical protein
MGSGAALAGGDWKKHDKQQPTQSQGATGGSGQVTEGTSGQLNQGTSGQLNQGTSGQMNQGTQAQQGSTQQLGANEIAGRVVKSSKKMLWVEHAGVIVPLTINKDTQFADPSIKRVQDLKAGDEIRASYEVKQTDNIATNIQKSDKAMGGSGTDVMKPDPLINPDPNSLPPSPLDNGTGGSGPGSDLTPPDISSQGTSSDLGSDTSKGTGDY